MTKLCSLCGGLVHHKSRTMHAGALSAMLLCRFYCFTFSFVATSNTGAQRLSTLQVQADNGERHIHYTTLRLVPVASSGC